MMEIQQKILEVAKAEVELEISEDAGKDEDLAGHIAKYRSAVIAGCESDRGPEPWCADFVSWVCKTAGYPLGELGTGFRKCSLMMEWFRSQGTFHQFSTPDDFHPGPGDIIFFDEDKEGNIDHCGIVESFNFEKKTFTSIEGNYSNRLSVVFRRDLEKVVGWAWL